MADRLRLSALLAALFLTFSLVAVDHADARRGGSFGSRGFRTYQSAPPTRTAPRNFGPVERSMSPDRTGAAQPGFNTAGTTGMRRPGLFGGLGGGLLGGLALGGLFGMLMGTGFGGMGGIMALLVQLLLVGVGVMFLMRFLRGRQAASMSGHSGSVPGSRGSARAGGVHREDVTAGMTASPAGGSGFRIPEIGSGAYARGTPAGNANEPSDEIGVSDTDLDIFEQRLQELQAAFSREDYGALRRITTPEVMSYLAEELSQNATSGKKNDVAEVKLLQGDIAEAWREGRMDYASVAMRYSSIDVMRDRETGAVVEGDPHEATETTELWTFVRDDGDVWKLSAIQER